MIVAANLTAMLIQTLSAKLGLATGQNLPEACRDAFPRPVSIGLWGQAEIVAIATDLAEVIGGAVALNLLFGLPLLAGGVITGVVAFALLASAATGAPAVRAAPSPGCSASSCSGSCSTVLRDAGAAGPLAAGLIPRFDGHREPAAGHRHPRRHGDAARHLPALGADLPAAIPPPRPRSGAACCPGTRRGVLVAMGLAGLVNAAMLIMAAAAVLRLRHAGTDTLEGVHAGLARVLDAPAAMLFALALLASGFASSGVGTYAGQIVMQGFIRRRIPLLLRRALTLAPALVVLDPRRRPHGGAGVLQVVLAFGIPFALVPLVLLTRDRALMGELVNRRVTTAAASVAALVIIGLNGVLLWHTFT